GRSARCPAPRAGRATCAPRADCRRTRTPRNPACPLLLSPRHESEARARDLSRGAAARVCCGSGGSAMRLRQVALPAAAVDPTLAALQRVLGLGEPFRDPGVTEFGLVNGVFALGDTFLEVVSPARPGTTAGRWLERRGGDAGYMAIFQ